MKDKSKKLLVINTSKKPSSAQSSTQSSGGTPNGGGFGGVAIDMSDYLLKSIWDRVWEIKTDSQGNEYIFGKLPVVTQYGITMYADGGELDLPSIYAGLPIDGTTIYWDGEVLKAQGGGSGGGITDITSSMVVSALGYTPAKASDLTTLQSTVNDFLSGSDTDTIINKWKELEVFLSGLSESDNLATILGTKAGKATTIAGYGITDAYTKSDVNTLLGDYVTLATAQTITGEKNFTGGLKVNGSTIVYDATNKYWKLEGDLLVTGGITMFANEGTYTPSTIMDALKLDDTTLGINDEGQLYVKSGTGGGVADSVRWENVIGRPTLLSSFTDDVVSGKYLPLNTSTTKILTSSQSGVLNFKSTSTSEVGIRLYFGETNGGGLWYNGVQGMYLYNTASATQLGLLNNGTPYYHDLSGNKRHLWHSGNFNPSNYLPTTGGIIKGSSDTPLQIKSPISNFVGLNLFTDETLALHLGYWDKLGGVRFENLRNQSKSGIGVLDNGLVVQYSYDNNYNFTKNKIWHAGNVGSGSGLSADMLDGYHWYGFYRSFIEGINAENVNTFADTKSSGTYSINHNGQYSGLLLSFNRGQGSVSSIELIAPHYDFHIYGLQARIAIDNNRYSALRTFAFTDSNVASATKLQTARTIWGQSFDGTKDITGDFKAIGTMTVETGAGWDTSKTLSLKNTADDHGRIGLHIYGQAQSNNDSIGGDGRSTIRFYRNYNKQASFTYSYGIQHHIPNDLLLLNNSSGAVASINQSGDVGIGTTSPRAKLSVQGGIDTYRSSGDYSGAIGFNRKSAVGGLYISSYHGHQIHNYKGDLQFYVEKTDTTWLIPLVIQGSTGNIGIGTDSPSSKLDVKGGVSAQSYGGYNGSAAASIYKWAIYQWNNELQITRRNSSNTHQGTMAGFDLASGNVVFEAGITMYSDQRKKTILNHVELSLKQIAEAPLIEHYYNSDESKTTHVGSIAQYWAEMNDWFCKKDNEGFYTMEIQNAALASAISIARELVKYESKTDKKIRLLKKRIGELEDEIEKLKTA